MDNTKENKQTLFLFPLIHYLTVLLGAEGAEGAAVGKMAAAVCRWRQSARGGGSTVGKYLKTIKPHRTVVSTD